MYKKTVSIVVFILLTTVLVSDEKLPLFYQNIKTVEDPYSYLVLVNKFYRLKENDMPHDLERISRAYANEDKFLRRKAKEAFEQLSSDAKKRGFSIVAVSAFRSFDYQEQLYQYYVEKMGKMGADVSSARAGHSEHQTGLTVDVMGENGDYNLFQETKEFRWMKRNAHKYGFIMRYPKGKEYITGFKYEPWHYRYVGVKAATNIYNNKITLEEYLFDINKN